VPSEVACLHRISKKRPLFRWNSDIQQSREVLPRPFLGLPRENGRGPGSLVTSGVVSPVGKRLREALRILLTFLALLGNYMTSFGLFPQ